MIITLIKSKIFTNLNWKRPVKNKDQRHCLQKPSHLLKSVDIKQDRNDLSWWFLYGPQQRHAQSQAHLSVVKSLHTGRKASNSWPFKEWPAMQPIQTVHFKFKSFCTSCVHMSRHGKFKPYSEAHSLAVS